MESAHRGADMFELGQDMALDAAQFGGFDTAHKTILRADKY